MYVSHSSIFFKWQYVCHMWQCMFKKKKRTPKFKYDLYWQFFYAQENAVTTNSVTNICIWLSSIFLEASTMCPLGLNLNLVCVFWFRKQEAVPITQ